MRDDKTARVGLNTQEKFIPRIWCYVDISHYPQLRVAKSDSVIWISGEIESFDGLTDINLSNVTLEFE